MVKPEKVNAKGEKIHDSALMPLIFKSI
jgi:hypothetical protein